MLTNHGTTHAPFRPYRDHTEQTTSPGTTEKPYDETGAMQFIVCTIIVYSVGGVCCTFVSRFRRYARNDSDFKFQDDAVNRYRKKERELKLEGYKMQMLNEITKHAENIKRYEDKQRLLELERLVQNEDFGASLSTSKRSRLRGFLKRNKKKQNIQRAAAANANNGAQQPRLGNRRKSASDVLGIGGFSFLFMDASNPRLQELQEEDEVDSVPESADISLSRSHIEIHVRSPDDNDVIDADDKTEDIEMNVKTNYSDGSHLKVEETILSSSL
ncbi:hypothetical protein ACF0H5_005529 [Mactra antiquata]